MFERCLYEHSLLRTSHSKKSVLYAITPREMGPKWAGPQHVLNFGGSAKLAIPITDQGLKDVLPSKLTKIGKLSLKRIGVLLAVLDSELRGSCNAEKGVLRVKQNIKPHKLQKSLKNQETYPAGVIHVNSEIISLDPEYSVSVITGDLYDALYLLVRLGRNDYWDYAIFVESCDSSEQLILCRDVPNRDCLMDLHNVDSFATVPAVVLRDKNEKNCEVCGKWTTSRPNIVPLCGPECVENFEMCNYVIRALEGPLPYKYCIMCQHPFVRDKRMIDEQRICTPKCLEDRKTKPPPKIFEG